MAEETEEKAEYQVLLSENYALDTDKLNLILKEKYQKKDGRSKNSNFIDEYGWSNLGYFGNLDSVGDKLVKNEMLTEEDIKELRHYAETIQRLRDEIVTHLKEKIVIVRRESKETVK